ncbi:aldo/keto reductase [Cohnella sp. AR92]|uniref:aldo/keto reductase n=1 Tax=Cohnella sp. AR92 TaxID=648716 RepID=UPI00131525A1|nr:aldo/keto reductase [Cohnella sp. AR92]
MKLALGTIPFGLGNRVLDHGRVPFQEVAAIMAYARQAGIETIDTAPGYGDSESIIGHIKEGYAFPRIITKTPEFPEEWIGPEPIGRMEAAFQRSLKTMRRRPVYAVVVRQGEDLLKPGGERIWERMTDWKAEGRTDKIGFSVFNGADELDRLMERYTPDLVQLPINALDRKLLTNGHLRQLRNAGIEIQARSVLLHGLLLLAPSSLPPAHDRLRAPLAALHWTWSQQGLTPLEGSLSFIRSIPEIDEVIVGFHSLQQIREVHRAFVELAAGEDGSGYWGGKSDWIGDGSDHASGDESDIANRDESDSTRGDGSDNASGDECDSTRGDGSDGSRGSDSKTSGTPNDTPPDEVWLDSRR